MHPYTPIYAPVDLDEFDEALKGETVELLQNPTYALREGYLGSEGEAFIAATCEICHVKGPDELRALFGPFEQAVFAWLFVPELGDDGKLIRPHVYEVWDRHNAERLKKAAARSKPQTSRAASEPAHSGG